MADNRPPHEPPPAAEWGQLRAWLAQNGFTQAQIREAIGQQPNGRTRAEIAAALIAWLTGRG